MAIVEVEKDGKKQKIETEIVLVAVGRRASTESLNLDKAGIRSEKGKILTDDHLMTNGRLLPKHVDVVFVNLYQAFAQNVHQFIRDFTASRIYLYHLPFRQDDCYQFWMQAGQAVRSFPSDLPPLKILTHMNWH